MKKTNMAGIAMRFGLHKIFKIMRLTVFLILICVFQVFAENGFSQNTRLTLEYTNTSVENVLLKIEEQSRYVFLYNKDMIDVKRSVDVKFTDATVENVMDAIFENTGVSYKIIGNQIALKPAIAIQSSNIKLSGKVTDTTGAPLPGVTVVVKGTTNGTITNFDGVYSLSDVPSDGTIQFSFVGMKMQEIAVDGKTSIDIVMEEDAIGIEEVVAIGYGTVKKQDLTGAVGSVQGSVIEERQTTQMSQALQGAVSGVMVTRNNNAPGSTATIRVRGITSIGDSNPLIIVDGVPVNNINDINPNDIESLSVLKDAASASIYGARAAAGVILITTKRAKSGELNLDYNFEYGIEKPTVSPDYADAVRYMQMVNELRWNDNGNGSDEYSTYPQNVVENYESLNKENPDLYPNTDWEALIFNKTAPKQSHVLSLSAGTKNIRTKASLAYDKINALYDGRTYERLTARFNNDLTISKYLSASIDFYAKRTINNQPVIDPIDMTRTTPPIYAALWSDGRISIGKAGENIYGQMLYGGFNDSWYNQLGGKISIDLTPFEGLKISAVVSPNLNFNKSKTFKQQIPTYTADDPSVFEGYLKGASSTSLSEGRDENYQVTTQFLVNYQKSLDAHNINAMMGFENYYAFYESLGASRDQYLLSSFPYLDLGPLEFRDNDGNAYENAYRSWFGRIMYNYNSKYFLQANIRYDASSRFHEDYRWGSFPSFSAGWVLSEESFMQDIDVLSFLKLRASWGTLGNERIGNYPYQSTMIFANTLFYEGNNINSFQTAAQRQYVIKDISWETTESIDIGVDASFFNNQFRITGDYYKKTTKDMLLALEIPDYIGFDNPDQNTGKMNTKGWEIELGYQNSIGDLKYNVSANISDFKSVMGDLGGTEFIGNQIKIEGSEYNEWYGYLSDGLYQTQEDVDNSAKLNSSVKPGDVKYKDVSGPDGTPDGIISPEYDRVLLGGSLPRYMYGANLKLAYKNIDFSMVIQGVGKQNVKMEQRMVQPFISQWLNMPLLIDGKYWSHYNTAEQNMNAKYPRFSDTSSGNNYAMSDYWLFNGSYLRLKNITLGYNVPESLSQKAGIKRCRIYTSFSDLFSLNNYPKGWDPENSSTGYPITTSVIFGISVKF